MSTKNYRWTSLLGVALATVLAAPVAAQEVLRITIRPSPVELAIDETLLLVAEATFTDGRTANISELVEWKSSNTGVVRVSNTRGSKGRVTARGAGQVSISVRDPVSDVTSGQSGGNAVISVLGRLVSLAVTPNSRTVDVGQTRSLTATGTFSSGTTRDLTQQIEWISSNPAVVQVSNEPGRRGRVTGVAPGTVRIAVRSTAGVTSSDTGGDATVRVPAALVSLSIVPKELNVPVGFTVLLDANGLYSDDSVDDVTNDVTWVSSNPAVANVSDAEGSKGELTSLQDGTAIISIVDPATGISSMPSGGDALITVAGTLVSIVITPARDQVPTALSRSLSVQGTVAAGGTTRTFNLARRSVQWFSSDPTVGAVSNDPRTAGVVTGVARGTVVISALHPGTGVRSTEAQVVDPATGAVTRNGDAQITVLGRMIGLVVRPRTRELFSGQNERFSAVALLDDGGEARITRDMEFASSDGAVAQVDSSGRTTGVSKGRATISAVHTPTGLSSATSGGNGTATVRGRVDALRIEPRRAFYMLGTKPRLRALATFDDGSSENIASDVTWSTSDPVVAEVGNEPPDRGFLLAKTVGRITVSAVEPVSGVSTTASGGDGTIIIVDGLERLRVEEDNLELRTGDVLRLQALGRFPNPAPQPGEPERVEIELSDFVQWSSSNEAVVRVDATGQLIAVGLGDATVSAFDARTGIISTQSGGDATFKVIAALEQIRLEPRTIRARLGSAKRRAFHAMGLYTDGARIEITDRVEFGTANPDVAQVSNERDRHGLVVPFKKGATQASAREPVTGVQAVQAHRIIVKNGKQQAKKRRR